MSDQVFESRTPMPVSGDELYAWHARPGAFQRLQPPWERVELVEHSGGVSNGARLRLRARVGPLVTEWTARHEGHQAGRQFIDVMERGPFAAWRHEHIFQPANHGAGSSTLIDRVTYRLPGGAFGRVLGGGFVARKLARMFRYRHAITRADLDLWRATREGARMKIAITGATGLVGSALAPFLSTQGHTVVRLSRSEGEGLARWDPARQQIDLRALAGVDAIVHLAGANVGDGRWSAARKRELVESRVPATRFLVDVLGRLRPAPRIFVCASATGFYGNSGDAEVDETSPTGEGFLADLCRQWEAEALRATEWGARVVLLRTGVILTPGGGALAKILPIFRSGLGGPVAGGGAWMSWITPDDVLGATAHLLAHPTLAGPVNLVAPEPVTNRAFATTLAHVLGRPAVAHVPAAALRLMYGQMAEETVLSSSRVRPQRLLESGYDFRFPALEPALRHVLGAM